MKKTFLLAIALLCFCAPMSLFAQKQLAFKDGKFKIVQFTDIHWDQKSSKCAKTVATIQSVLKAENPDVAMLTGDVVTANPGLEGWKSVIGIFEEAKIPFTVMMGNHDAEIVPKDEIFMEPETMWYRSTVQTERNRRPYCIVSTPTIILR